MEFLTVLNLIFSLGTIATQVFLVATIAHFLFFKNNGLLPIKRFFAWISRRAILLAFLVALVSTAASLFYSNVVGFAPCDLCWFQRIFMYPLVILFGVALIKKDSRVVMYTLPTAIVGGIISLYQNYIYYSNGGLNAICQFTGLGVSCTKRYVFEFGYVTIPVMALTAFALIITLLLLSKRANHD
ncbi:MAG: disulfide bond formation protein B [bacterium]|nr:disulfide bond formation protein B [bacterium]